MEGGVVEGLLDGLEEGCDVGAEGWDGRFFGGHCEIGGLGAQF